MQDESLHEIQLNGKQLVFLFMAATVVAVVIFLCGVMVGRGVPQRAGVAPGVPEQAASDPTAAVQQLPPPLAVASTGSAPLTAGETLTYPNRLADAAPPAETLKPVAETAVLTEPTPASQASKPAPAPEPAPKSAAAGAAAPAPKPAAPAAKPAPVAAAAQKPDAPAPKPAAPAPKPAPASEAPKPAAPAPAPPKPAPAPNPSPAAAGDPAFAEPPGNGFVVQVAAVRKREDAEAMARRLSAKGYPTFVTVSGPNFRVRVGKYDDRKETEAVAARLEKEERVRRAGGEPWVLDRAADRPADVVARAAGILLTGGGDVEPSIYGEAPHPTFVAAEAGRDAYEIELVRRALDADVPLFAICRGLQVLNVARGGTLIQDIPSQVPGALTHKREGTEPSFTLAHEVWLETGSVLGRLMTDSLSDVESCHVNSRHHQAIKAAGEGLVTVATAPDGIIEALEDPTRHFCLGVQWHPENFYRTGEFRGLFEGFVKAATR